MQNKKKRENRFHIPKKRRSIMLLHLHIFSYIYYIDNSNGFYLYIFTINVQNIQLFKQIFSQNIFPSKRFFFCSPHHFPFIVHILYTVLGTNFSREFKHNLYAENVRLFSFHFSFFFCSLFLVRQFVFTNSLCERPTD